MARYRAKNLLYVSARLIQPGEVFESEDKPGSQWEPLDVEKKEVAAEPDKQAPSPGLSEVVRIDIPEEWKSQTALSRINLARKLGADKSGLNKDKADEFIAAEIEKRKAASAEE